MKSVLCCLAIFLGIGDIFLVRSLSSVSNSRSTLKLSPNAPPTATHLHTQQQPPPKSPLSRRHWLGHFTAAVSSSAVVAGMSVSYPQVAAAAPADCFTDCFKNCQKLAPKDGDYCRESCTDYCAQPDRQDGLSGSVGAAQGEVGILGGSFGTGTVVKGKDKPPTVALPGLDFSSEGGKKLLGY